MEGYKTQAKKFLSDYALKTRTRKGLSQEKFASQLGITGRAYGDLERGKYCFSATALLFLLVMLDDNEIREMLNDFLKFIDSEESQDIAS